mmetsp:Transcript_11403/g.16631  ORF Transcript_11403/g.16631 Transcript_11403/m.16631 type:complete len:128 (-) Transcript_11403:75-458(-)
MEEVSTPKKRKKKKKKEKTEQNINLSAEEEQIITISKKEQKAAAKAVSKAVKAAAKAEAAEKVDEDDASTISSSKKVKFRKMNTAKSYKASMKDLKKVNPKITLEKTPEKGILLSKRAQKKRKNMFS